MLKKRINFNFMACVCRRLPMDISTETFPKRFLPPKSISLMSILLLSLCLDLYLHWSCWTLLTVWGILIHNHFRRSFYSCDWTLQCNSDNVLCPTLLWHNDSTNITRLYTVAWLGFFDLHAKLTDAPVISMRYLTFYKIITNRLGFWN
jgi:hypothetical protein